MECVCKGIIDSTLCGGTVNDMVYNNTCPIISTISRGEQDWKGK